MTTAKTERVRVSFVVREYGDGQPWIVIEPEAGKILPCVGDGFLGLDLKPGTTYDEARGVAEFLSDRVTNVSHTLFVTEIMQTKPF